MLYTANLSSHKPQSSSSMQFINQMQVPMTQHGTGLITGHLDKILASTYGSRHPHRPLMLLKPFPILYGDQSYVL